MGPEDRDELVGRGEATIGFGVDVGRSNSLSMERPVAKCSSEHAAALRASALTMAVLVRHCCKDA